MIICKKCNKKIVDEEYIRVNLYYFHINHFICSGCDADLNDKEILESKGNIFCKPCWISKTMDKCESCKEPIREDYIEAAGKKYHTDHFSCSICKCLLEDSFNKHKGAPCCRDCFAQTLEGDCIVCGKKIEGKRISIEDRLWHQGCLICHLCTKPILKGITSWDETGEYHYDCFLEARAPKCNFCKEPLSGRYVHAKGSDSKVHKQCFQFFLKMENI